MCGRAIVYECVCMWERDSNIVAYYSSGINTTPVISLNMAMIIIIYINWLLLLLADFTARKVDFSFEYHFLLEEKKKTMTSKQRVFEYLWWCSCNWNSIHTKNHTKNSTHKKNEIHQNSNAQIINYYMNKTVSLSLGFFFGISSYERDKKFKIEKVTRYRTNEIFFYLIFIYEKKKPLGKLVTLWKFYAYVENIATTSNDIQIDIKQFSLLNRMCVCVCMSVYHGAGTVQYIHLLSHLRKCVHTLKRYD